jgi:cysteinyl-tRNA synthetase
MAYSRCATPGAATPDAALTERFGNEINDDLNLPRALAVAWETLRGDLAPDVKRATLLGFDAVLGLRLAEWAPKQEAVPAAVTALAEARLARAADEELGRRGSPSHRVACGGLGDGRPARTATH